MDSHLTGSNTFLEIQTEEVEIVIKPKKEWVGDVADRSSSLLVGGFGLKEIIIGATSEVLKYGHESASLSGIELVVPPLFFEQMDYEIVARSKNNRGITFWNENYSVRDKVGRVSKDDPTLISGIINFDNSIGYSDLIFELNGIEHLRIRIEVYPSKISYKEDYRAMVNDISEMVCEVALDFMKKTYQMLSLDDKSNSIMAVYIQILRTIFKDFMIATNRIIVVPHHKLITEHQVVAQHKAKRIDRKTEKWLLHHRDYVDVSDGIIKAEKVLAARKQVTYDTTENQFVKFVLTSTIRRVEDFLKLYCKPNQKVEEAVVADLNDMLRRIRRVLNSSFLRDVSEYSSSKSMSLVFGMAPGYRELYKCYVMLNKSLSFKGDIFKISLKDTAELYECWCYIKLFSLLKKEYQLLTPDIIRVDNTGITVTLTKGKSSESRFFNPRTGEKITLTYNPAENETQTVNQKPDNVLELEKKGSETSYKYVFDAKYRIEKDPKNKYYPDENPGPKVDDINTMHRYRDSIVYENKQSRFTFEKTMFGAYVLFPYDDEEKYKNHRFYKSIETVNIGGLPFLPGVTTLVQKLLAELISDSNESAFERGSLPIGIDDRLSKIDWNKRDVLISTVESREQFDACIAKGVYYIPEKLVERNSLPISRVALYQPDKLFTENSGIRYFGELIGLSMVRGKDITDVPLKLSSPEELFYRLKVKQWDDITKTNSSGKPIQGVDPNYAPFFTNQFLLNHSEYVQELLIENEGQYRFFTELKRHYPQADVVNEDGYTCFAYESMMCAFDKGELNIIRDGKIETVITISEFEKNPSKAFRYLQYIVFDRRNEV